MAMTYSATHGLQICLKDRDFSEVIKSVVNTPEIFAYEVYDTLKANNVPHEIAKATAITFSQQTQRGINQKSTYPHLFLDDYSVIH